MLLPCDFETKFPQFFGLDHSALPARSDQAFVEQTEPEVQQTTEDSGVVMTHHGCADAACQRGACCA